MYALETIWAKAGPTDKGILENPSSLTLIILKRISGRIVTGGKPVDLLATRPIYHPDIPTYPTWMKVSQRETYRLPSYSPW